METTGAATKTCTTCRYTFPLSSFYHGKGKPQARCKECTKAWQRQYRVTNPDAVRESAKRSNARNYATTLRPYRLKKQYGITMDEYEAMREAQGDRCAVCGRPETSLSRNGETVKDLAVDHDHETGRVRELLCSSCNVAVGLLGDDPERTHALTLYLRKHSTDKGA